tara:strand:- start:13405 stop:14586 length:1182 start_codon:yes stop_codon:yes gene_type:complete
MNFHLNFNHFKNTFLFWLVLSLYSLPNRAQIITGAEDTEGYLFELKGKKIGVVAHQSSLIFTSHKQKHLVDLLLENKIDIKSVFAPEHGFRGIADAGEKIDDDKDPLTNLPIYSLYGKNRKPSQEQLKGIELMVFDLQDVGVRFFTYLSTLHYVMEACAEQNISVIVLDRPNPNSHYIDGPVLNHENSSFVGMHPVPIVYGMTIGEYAKMINGEGWLSNGISCDLKVIPIQNYTHKTPYELIIRPSPNLPNAQAISLYPSLCLLEQTKISIGRGTNKQFQIYGHPSFSKNQFSFTPKPNFGAKNPKQNGILCYGVDLTKIKKPDRVELKWLIDAYTNFPEKSSFFLKGFNRISGINDLKIQIKQQIPESEIRKTWSQDLEKFRKIRAKYLIYP